VDDARNDLKMTNVNNLKEMALNRKAYNYLFEKAKSHKGLCSSWKKKN